MEIFNEIAREIQRSTNKKMRQVATSIGLDLGVITSSGLKLDNFKYEIQDYMMLDYLKLNNEQNTEISGEHPHKHTFEIPDNLKALKDGDRVLVAVMGADFVVVGRV